MCRVFICFLLSFGYVSADIAVVMHAHTKTLTDPLLCQNAVWQLLSDELQQRGEKLVFNNLDDHEIDTLKSPSTRAVIVNNIPDWTGKDWKKILSPIRAKKILLCWEPPTVLLQLYNRINWKPFDIVLTWNPKLVNNTKVLPLFYPSLKPLEDNPSTHKRLVTMICGNKSSKHPNELYSLRKNIIHYFEHHPQKDFAFYGRGWPKDRFKTYGGVTKDKIATLQKFRYCLCFENARDCPGYITEKIFDCFAAGCVPIYYGAPDIPKYIPNECYISWKSSQSIENLYPHLQNMREKKYRGYLSNIKKFLSSEKAQAFSKEMFVAKMLTLIGLPKGGSQGKKMSDFFQRTKSRSTQTCQTR